MLDSHTRKQVHFLHFPYIIWDLPDILFGSMLAFAKTTNIDTHNSLSLDAALNIDTHMIII